MEIKSFQEKSASISLILGISAVILFMIIIGLPFDVLRRIPYEFNLITSLILLVIFPLLVILLGIIFGLLGLKSRKRKLAILGIVLSLIPIICAIGLLQYLKRFI